MHRVYARSRNPGAQADFKSEGTIGQWTADKTFMMLQVAHSKPFIVNCSAMARNPPGHNVAL